jgi:4-hydroxy-3-methylbut-2-enyl diphosphate reductase
MQVIRAAAMGMCFGVRDALQVVRGVETPANVTIHGELVHNGEVIRELDERGFHRTPETRRAALPMTDDVLITAHGLSNREKARLRDAGKHLIDTTCPLVEVVHEAAQKLQAEGYFVLVLGKRSHVEVVGIIGDLERFDVVQSMADVKTYAAPRLGIVCQSTTQPAEAKRLHQAIAAANPGKEIRFIDTICKPTRDRQRAALELIEQVEALVVVGGRQSNNTRQLVRLAEERDLPVVHVETADDLEPLWFQGYRVVGLTAGTSTLDETIDAVHDRLCSFDALELAALASVS